MISPACDPGTESFFSLHGPVKRRQSAKIVRVASFYNSRYENTQKKGNKNGNAERVRHANNVAKKRRCVRPLKCGRTQNARLHYSVGSCDPCDGRKTSRHSINVCINVHVNVCINVCINVRINVCISLLQKYVERCDETYRETFEFLKRGRACLSSSIPELLPYTSQFTQMQLVLRYPSTFNGRQLIDCELLALVFNTVPELSL